MKQIRGLHIIECLTKKCPKDLREMEAPCMGCADGVTKVFDLDGNIVYEHIWRKKKGGKTK